MRYEYIGKKEIYSRVKALGYEMPKISRFLYSRFEGVEWLECREFKIMVQRAGNWMRIVDYQAHVDNVRIYAGYIDGAYTERY